MEGFGDVGWVKNLVTIQLFAHFVIEMKSQDQNYWMLMSVA